MDARVYLGETFDAISGFRGILRFATPEKRMLSASVD
jgi:hypothetical protein